MFQLPKIIMDRIAEILIREPQPLPVAAPMRHAGCVREPAKIAAEVLVGEAVKAVVRAPVRVIADNCSTETENHFWSIRI